jgi:hypothetical protein
MWGESETSGGLEQCLGTDVKSGSAEMGIAFHSEMTFFFAFDFLGLHTVACGQGMHEQILAS